MPKKYGIVLVADDETNRKAIELSGQYLEIADDRGFTLGLEQNAPHISLLHIMLDDTRVKTCLAALRHALRGRGPLDGAFDAVQSRNGYLFWTTPKSEALARLQLAVVSACAHLRSGDVKISWPLGPERKAMMRRYGYPNVGQCFNPHVTLRTVLPEFAERRFEDSDWRWWSTYVAFCHADAKGVMTSVIERIPLVSP